MKEFTETHLPALAGTVGRLDRIHLMAAAFGIGLTAFLAIEPTQNWLLLLLTLLVGLGTDGIIRTHPKAHFHRLDDTALYLFLPVLFTLALGLFLEEAAAGYWTVPAGLMAAVPFGYILQAEYNSVDRQARTYQTARLVLNVATYVTAFLFYASIYDFGLELPPSSFGIGVVSVLLAVEVLREEALETPRTLIYALAIGVLLAETAWAIHFLPLVEPAAAMFVLLGFYLTTGLMHNHLGQRLNLYTAGEFFAMSAAGLIVIVVSHNFVFA